MNNINSTSKFHKFNQLLRDIYHCAVKYQGFGRIIEVDFIGFIPDMKSFLNVVPVNLKNHLYQSDSFKKRKENNLIEISDAKFKNFFRFLVINYPSAIFEHFNHLPDMILDFDEKRIVIPEKYADKFIIILSDFFSYKIISDREFLEIYKKLKSDLKSPDYYVNNPLQNEVEETSNSLISTEIDIDQKDLPYKYNISLTSDENSILEAIHKYNLLNLPELVKIVAINQDLLRAISNSLFEKGYLNKAKLGNFYGYYRDEFSKALEKRINLHSTDILNLLKEGPQLFKPIIMKLLEKYSFISRSTITLILKNLVKDKKVILFERDFFIYILRIYCLKENEQQAKLLFDERMERTGLYKRKEKRINEEIAGICNLLDLNEEEKKVFLEKLAIIGDPDYKGHSYRAVLLSLAFLIFKNKKLYNSGRFTAKYDISRKTFNHILNTYKSLLFNGNEEEYHQLIKSYIQENNYPENFEKDALNFLTNIYSTNIHQGKNPKGLIASLFYLLHKRIDYFDKKGKKIILTQWGLSKRFNICEVTIRNIMKELKKI